MRSFLHLKKTDQNGFDHVLTGLVFAVLIALGGTYYLLMANADSWSGALKVSVADTNLCMENMDNASSAYSIVEINSCTNNSEAQHWSFRSQGSNFQIVATTSKACIDDYKQRVSMSGGNKVIVETVPCSATNDQQLWHWGGTANHQLINVASGACLSDPGSAAVPATTYVTIAPCSSNSTTNTNEQWLEAVNSFSRDTTASGNQPITAPPVSSTSVITGTFSSNICLTAGNSITLQYCSDSNAQQWGQVSATSGPIVQFYNAASKMYFGVSGDTVVGTPSSGSALWYEGTGGNGGTTLMQLDGNGNDLCLDTGKATLNSIPKVIACNNSVAQSFDIPAPYTITGAGSNGSLSTNTSSIITTLNASTNSSKDINTLLHALKSSGTSFNCNELSISERTQCQQVIDN